MARELVNERQNYSAVRRTVLHWVVTLVILVGFAWSFSSPFRTTNCPLAGKSARREYLDKAVSWDATRDVRTGSAAANTLPAVRNG